MEKALNEQKARIEAVDGESPEDSPLCCNDLLTGMWAMNKQLTPGRMKPEKLSDYLSDLFFHAREGVDRFITRTGAPFYKAYRDGVVWFHIHFATNAAEYCAVFKRNPGAEFHATGVTARNGGEQISRAANRHGGLGQGIMLVSVA